jgi:hypothetical protein
MNKLPCLSYNIIQIRDNIDGRLGFIDRPQWMKKNKNPNDPVIFNEFKMTDSPYMVTADEYVEAMIFLHEKNYSLVRVVSYNTMVECSQKWKGDFYKC